MTKTAKKTKKAPKGISLKEREAEKRATWQLIEARSDRGDVAPWSDIVEKSTEETLRRRIHAHEARADDAEAKAEESARVWEKFKPMVKHGQKFQGRKTGAFGALKKMLKREIKRLHAQGKKTTPAPLWRHFELTPPNGWDVAGDVGDAGAKIWKYGDDESWPYKSFANSVGVVRRTLGIK